MMTDRPAEVPWHKLLRRVRHRTSAPTAAELRQVVAEVALARGGRAPSADAVMLAALRLARSRVAAIAEEVGIIEGGWFREEE